MDYFFLILILAQVIYLQPQTGLHALSSVISQCTFLQILMEIFFYSCLGHAFPPHTNTKFLALSSPFQNSPISKLSLVYLFFKVCLDPIGPKWTLLFRIIISASPVTGWLWTSTYPLSVSVLSAVKWSSWQDVFAGICMTVMGVYLGLADP